VFRRRGVKQKVTPLRMRYTAIVTHTSDAIVHDTHYSRAVEVGAFAASRTSSFPNHNRNIW
jgi:hypothetical protein